jgi:hypothetical protein
MRLRTSITRIVVQAIMLGSLCLVPCASAQQEATVTFYTHGSPWTTGIPGTHHDIFIGSIFDGTQGLFTFRDAYFAHNNRFLTLRIPAGTHTFGASYGKAPRPRETVTYDLKAGEHYFIRAQAETAGMPGVFTAQHGFLEYIPCVEAQVDLIKATPLKDKGLWKYLRARKDQMIVPEASAPGCGSSLAQ